MISFFVCLAILIIGFMLYSKVAEKVFGPDDRKPPALSMTDGSDYGKGYLNTAPAVL